MSNVRVLATDLEFPEGPVVMPDGSVVLVEIRGQRLTRVHPDGRKEIVAKVPGGPNGAALGPDGKIYICNNGGFSWIPTRNMIMPGPQPDDYLGGSIQRLDLAALQFDALDRAALVILGLRTRHDHFAGRNPGEAAIVADIHLAVGPERGAIRPARHLRHDCLAAIGINPRERLPSDFDNDN